MTKTIQLTQGKVAVVDDADYPSLSAHRWHACESSRTWYAERTVCLGAGNKRTVKMHQEIAGIIPGMEIDHIDGDGLHNQRSNLRHVTSQQNRRNLTHRKQQCAAAPYKGVVFNKQRKAYQARIGLNRRKVNLGWFKDAKDAARAYNAAALKNFGELACLNVIEEEV